MYGIIYTENLPQSALTELVKNPHETTHVLTFFEEHSTDPSLSQIMNCQRYSSLDDLLRVTAYFLKFISKVRRCLSKEMHVTGGGVIDFEDYHELNATNLNQAETLWLSTVQTNSFPNEISYISKVRQALPGRVQQFQLFLDEDNLLLRCRGRLNNASIQAETKNPILMSTTYPFVELLIRNTHQTVKHTSGDITLTCSSRTILDSPRETSVLRRCLPAYKLLMRP